MTSISTIGQSTYIQSLLQATQNSLNTAQDQMSSGLIADTYAGLGASNTYQSVSLRAQNNQLNAYSGNINTVSAITSSLDAGMTDITDGAQSVSSSLQAAVQGDHDPGMAQFNIQAKDALTAMQHTLNTQVDNRYIFAASDTQTAPIASTTALNTQISTDLASYTAGTITATQFLANVAAYTPAQSGYSSTLASASNVSVRTNDGVDTDYTVKANNTGFDQVQKGLAIIANLQYNPSDPAGFNQIYNAATQMITGGTSHVATTQSILGIASKQLTDTQTQISASQTVLNTAIGSAEDVDAATAATQLKNLQTQLQTSYTVIGDLSGLSLVDYLKSGG